MPDKNQPSNNPSFRPVSIAVPPVAVKIFGSLFFTFHYGMFTAIHGLFVFLLISGMFDGYASTAPPLNYTPIILLWLVLLFAQVGRALLAPRTNTSIQELFVAPYKRIAPLHLAIIFGGFGISVLNLPAAAGIILIIIHIVVDVNTARKTKNQVKPATINDLQK